MSFGIISQVVLEGLDAAGKATQARLLKTAFEARGREAVIFSFPRYETETGKDILRFLQGDVGVHAHHGRPGDTWREPGGLANHVEARVLQALFLADKCDALVDMVGHMSAGRVVICDRWWQSAVCFGKADGLDDIWLSRIHTVLDVGGVNLNVFIDVPEDEALLRRPEARDRYERDREKQKLVRANYKQLWTSAGVDYVTINGVGAVGDVHARIWDAIRERA